MERIINAERIEQIINVFGSFDENIKRIEQTFHVKITNRGTELKIAGDEEAADKGARALEGLLTLAAKGETIDEQRSVISLTWYRPAMTISSIKWPRMWSVLLPRANPLRPKQSVSRTI